MIEFKSRSDKSTNLDVRIRSKRKPHNRDAGYIAERKFYDSHIVIYNAEAQGVDCDEKYAVVCSQHGSILSASSIPQARESMKNPEFCDGCMNSEHWANKHNPRFAKALRLSHGQSTNTATNLTPKTKPRS